MWLRHCLLVLILAGAGEVLGGRGGGFRTGGRGGGWGSSSSSSRGGWFSRGSSSRSAQTQTSRSGGWASRNTNTGTGSSSYPKQQYGSSSSLSRSSSSSSLGGNRNSIGGGGFVNPRKPAYTTNPYGTKQYSGYNTPRVSWSLLFSNHYNSLCDPVIHRGRVRVRLQLIRIPDPGLRHQLGDKLCRGSGKIFKGIIVHLIFLDDIFLYFCRATLAKLSVWDWRRDSWAGLRWEPLGRWQCTAPTTDTTCTDR